MSKFRESDDRRFAVRRGALLLTSGLLSVAGMPHASLGQTEHPPPSQFQIGNAVAPLSYYMSAWTVNDLFKMAGGEVEIGETRMPSVWTPVIGGQWSGERAGEIPTDAMGWATSLTLTGGGTADRLTAIVLDGDRAADFPSGTYRVLWEGSGDLVVEGPASVTPVGPNELAVEFNGTGGIIVSILSTDPAGTGDYIRNIRVLRPDAVAGEVFNRTYLDDIRPYNVIRPMHMTGENLAYGPAIDWDDRKPLGYAAWGGGFGVPYEVQIDLANAADADLWMTVPIAAGDAFMRSLAELAEDRLDGDRRLYIELGNEIWNWAAPYAHGRVYAGEQARLRWPGVEGTVTPYSDGDPVSEPMMSFSWQGARTAEMGAIFRDAFGDEADRVTVVLAGQVGASVPYYDNNRFLLESPVWVGEEGAEPAGTHADAFAIAPYVDEPEGGVGFSQQNPAAFIADAIRYYRGDAPWGPGSVEPGVRYQIRSDKALADEFGLPLVAYEGGQHFIGTVFERDDVNPHQDMAELYREIFGVWRDEGGGLFVHFAGILPRGQNEPGTVPDYYQTENFGIKERQTDDETNAPKWRALRDEMRGTGQLSSCGADIAPPAGVLDLADINLFTGSFLAGDDLADMNGDGLLDLADISLFSAFFLSGCP